ncbi:Cytochrome c6, chloroplastic [Zostera marina]|uniref:Cytochrome c-553 n=1 Tax=Zostera marina TaxID=29655 RepID=A0A0K9P7D9_ZOSMR|nr:Cytochrome c6, chloroplastic [Zostera marina]
MSVIAPFLVANVKGCLGIEGKIERWVGLPVMAAILTLSTPLFVTTPVSLAEMVDVPRASSLFQKACIGCHVGGGNILQPGATLLMKDLERNGAASEDELYNITYYGKGRMPGFGEKCTPRGQCTFGPRLQDEDIATLAKFVRLQAEKGWPNIEY